MLSLNPSHESWYQREMALYHHHHLDLPIEDFSPDDELDGQFKDVKTLLKKKREGKEKEKRE